MRRLLGIFGSSGVLPLEFKPAYTVGDLEQEAETKGGVQQVLEDHFATVYRVNANFANMAGDAPHDAPVYRTP